MIKANGYLKRTYGELRGLRTELGFLLLSSPDFLWNSLVLISCWGGAMDRYTRAVLEGE